MELKVPEVGESITEIEIGAWRKKEGDAVEQDEIVVEIETDKATLEVPAPAKGRLKEIRKQTGDAAQVGEVIGVLAEGEAEEAASDAEGDGEKAKRPEEKEKEKEKGKAKRAKTEEAERERDEEPASDDDEGGEGDEGEEGDEADAGAAARDRGTRPDGRASRTPRASPSARRALREHDVDAGGVRGSGPSGQVTKGDVLRALRRREEGGEGDGILRREERQRMTPLRRTIARRLVEAQQQAALLTTFNEIDMGAVIALRDEHGERFRERHGVKLGFMSFFVKAVVEGLQEFPAVNAEVDGDDVVYRGYYDIGVAIGGGRGLVVPVLRNAEWLGFAEIESQIHDLAERARENRLEPHELEGGTFSITNGGVYGSLLSTPIVNPPQSGILGLHAIQKRPVERDDEIVLRPMMYVALTYDHRVVDGREAVSFLRRVKDVVEAPSRILLEV